MGIHFLNIINRKYDLKTMMPALSMAMMRGAEVATNAVAARIRELEEDVALNRRNLVMRY